MTRNSLLLHLAATKLLPISCFSVCLFSFSFLLFIFFFQKIQQKGRTLCLAKKRPKSCAFGVSNPVLGTSLTRQVARMPRLRPCWEVRGWWCGGVGEEGRERRLRALPLFGAVFRPPPVCWCCSRSLGRLISRFYVHMCVYLFFLFCFSFHMSCHFVVLVIFCFPHLSFQFLPVRLFTYMFIFQFSFQSFAKRHLPKKPGFRVYSSPRKWPSFLGPFLSGPPLLGHPFPFVQGPWLRRPSQLNKNSIILSKKN